MSSALADSAAAEDGREGRRTTSITTAEATARALPERTERRAKLLLDNAEQLYQYNLIAKQDYDQKKADYDSAAASVRENEARLAQMKAQRAQTAAQLSFLSAARRAGAGRPGAH